MWKPRALTAAESWATLQDAKVLALPALLPNPAELAAAVVAARPAWTPDFGGDQFSLGRAWYTHLESGRARHYFRDQAKADALVERVLPGMQAGVRRVLAELVQAEVVPRPGFCGAGVHVFAPGSPVAHAGGSIHADLEGLRTAEERAGDALSFVLMLQPAPRGGGLRTWAPDRALDYGAGDAIVFTSQTQHQIQPFAGGERISITCHALRTAAGPWQAWF